MALSQAVLADAGRRKVVWVVLVFAALLAVAVPALPSYGNEILSQVYREVTVALMYTAAMVVGIALSATRIPAEVERRTVFNVLSRDVRRWEYVVGTWTGMLVVVGLVVAAFSVVAIGVGFLVYKQVMLVLLEAGVAIWFETGVVMALVVLVSTKMSPATAVVAALAFLFIGHSLPGLFTDAPWWLPSLEPFNVINQVAHGSGVPLTFGFAMVGAFGAWVGLLLTGASSLFAGRDL